MRTFMVIVAGVNMVWMIENPGGLRWFFLIGVVVSLDSAIRWGGK